MTEFASHATNWFEGSATMIRFAAWSVSLLLFAGCTNDTGGPRVTSPTVARFSDGDFVLVRLNGDRYPGEPVPDGSELLHGWEIVESLPIESVHDRARIFTAFEEGEEEANRNPGIAIDCFRPRHAIRIDRDGTTTDHLICFQCRNFMTWTDGEMTGGGSMSDLPKDVFESYLDEAAP